MIGKRKGRFVVIEGIDGAGTTTQTGMLVERLAAVGVKCHRTAEPSGGAIGKEIRRFLADGKKDPAALALLFAADRLDHLRTEIYPSVIAGKWVISDRYRLSSVAYQTLDCDEKWVAEINREAPPPDLTILIDLPVDVALERIGHRGGRKERFEKKDLLEKVKKNYLKFAKKRREGRVVVVDGTVGVDELSGVISEISLRLR